MPGVPRPFISSKSWLCAPKVRARRCLAAIIWEYLDSQYLGSLNEHRRYFFGNSRGEGMGFFKKGAISQHPKDQTILQRLRGRGLGLPCRAASKDNRH